MRRTQASTSTKNTIRSAAPETHAGAGQQADQPVEVSAMVREDHGLATSRLNTLTCGKQTIGMAEQA